MKYLLLIALVLFVLWVMRRNRGRAAASPPATRPAEKMVSCAHCGVNLPVSESICSEGRHYCCVAHQRADEARSH